MRLLVGLIPLLPLAGFLVCGLLGRRLSRKAVSWVACGCVLAAFVVSVGITLALRSHPSAQGPGIGGPSFEVRYGTWIPPIPFEGPARPADDGTRLQRDDSSGDEGASAGPDMPPPSLLIPEDATAESASHERGPERQLRVDFGLRLDPLSAIMILIVTGVGFLIHVYSTGYMAGDPGYARYFAYLNLFTAMMLTLVLANNFLLMFVGWEGVGLCSYLLIGFWYEDPEKAQAGRKAFITNRIGDFAFMLGILAILFHFGTMDFSSVMAAIGESGASGVSTGMLTAIGLALFVGACGKSAQIPLFVWLPDAMAGPTPVSALIHAATMVTAGVYMVARCSVLYVHAPAALAVIGVVGAATALFAATVGLAQTDIKKVLAYSTISQLGYMFLAAGVGAFGASIFHLMTHAFFKALLFLGAGSVIHAMGGEQDMRRMGGLKSALPWTYRTMMVAALAIAGIPVFAGFFSKDEILWSAWKSGNPGLWAAGALAAGLTALYMFRLIFLTFHGSFRGSPDKAHHLHESPPSMLVPLIVLAVLSIVGGWAGIPHSLGGMVGIPNAVEEYLGPVLAKPSHDGASGADAAGQSGGAVDLPGAHSAPLPAGHASGGPEEYVLMLVAIAIAAAGILLAYVVYAGPSPLPGRIAAAAGPLYRLILNKYWVDELYEATVLRAYHAVSAFFDGVDRWVIDGLVNAVAGFTEMIGQILRLFQTGFVRHYALWIFAGAVMLAWMLGR